ncbi:MAG TPA: ankyrin repeat domain-containing protein [Solirubrobacteraceae bacterium]|jgi:ankyrin repeat protein|nr:ankyrin repeat domain-containing protein [Solirubrobacteraceae bacterium]
MELIEAAKAGDAATIVRLLATDEGEVDALGEDGFAALHYAAFQGGAAATRALLEGGADPNIVARNTMLVRPLHSAAAVRDVASAELLLDAGAEPDARQQLGYTALHAAAQNDDEALAVLLLRHGADPSLRNEQGATARSIAEAHESTAVLALLG